MNRNRRDFIGLASGAAAAALVKPAAALAAPPCTNPGPSTPGKPWTIPYGQLQKPRVSVYTYTAAQWTLLNNAYTKMRALPASDPRSLTAQQNVHAWYCAQCNSTVADIHGRWTFFAWHRAFLFFHERILGSLVGDMSLRLPYWDWENPARRVLPANYYSGALNDTTRQLTSGMSVERNVPGVGYYDLNQVPAQIALNFTNVGGDATSAGVVENGEHGFVHMSVGGINGDMGNLLLAAGDPVFFAHHSNVDRLWYSWENYGGHADPTGAFQALSFTFYDENKVWRSITAAQTIPTTKLGYTYDTKVTPPLKFTNLHPFPLLLERNLIKPPSPETVTAAGEAAQTVVSLSKLQFTGTGVFIVEVHHGSTTHEVGRFFVVPHMQGRAMDTGTRRANLNFIVGPDVAKALAQSGAAITVRQSVPGSKLLAVPFGKPAPAALESLSIAPVR